MVVPPKGSVKFNPRRENGSDFRLESNSRVASYRFEERPIPEKFAHVKSGGATISLQLAEGGKLYLIPPRSTEAVLVPPAQPEGFPLEPLSNDLK